MTFHRPQVVIRPEFCVALAFGLLLVSWKWVISWIVASVVHELFHFIALRLCKLKVWRIQIGLLGTVMETESLHSKHELLSALSGPVGSLMLLLFSSCFPALAICGLFQFIFNMLPVFPADGGRVLHALAKSILPLDKADIISAIIGDGMILFVAILGLYLQIYHRAGMLVLIISALLWIKRKIPCKECGLKVQ